MSHGEGYEANYTRAYKGFHQESQVTCCHISLTKAGHTAATNFEEAGKGNPTACLAG